MNMTSYRRHDRASGRHAVRAAESDGIAVLRSFEALRPLACAARWYALLVSAARWCLIPVCAACWCVVVTVPSHGQTSSDSGLVLHLADQRLTDARLIDITENGGFTFQLGARSETATKTFDGHEIVRWGKQRASSGAALVWLADGSWLAGQLQWKSDQAFELVSDWFAPMELTITQVRGLVLKPSPSIQRFGELERKMQRLTGSADAIWNGRSEQLSGVLAVKLRPAVEAGLPPSAVWLLKTTASAEQIELESDSVQAIAFSPILRRPVRPPASALRLDLRDGSQLNVIAIGRSSKGRITLTLADHRVLEALDNSAQFVSAVARISGEPERIVWLDSLEPARYRFAQQKGELTWDLGRNQDLFGQPLSIAGETVPHGIAMHAPSQVAYRWDGRPAKFLAEVGLYRTPDGLPTPVGSAECTVLVARQGKLVEIYRSPVLRPTAPAAPVEVDISDAQLVVLLVEQADQGPVGDHVLWREARLVPSANAQMPSK